MVQAAPSGLRFWLTVDHRTNNVICWNNIFGDFFDESKISDRHWLTACKHYQKCDVIYRYFHIELIWCLLMVQYLQNNVIVKWTIHFTGWLPLKYCSTTTGPIIITHCKKNSGCQASYFTLRSQNLQYKTPPSFDLLTDEFSKRISIKRRALY